MYLESICNDNTVHVLNGLYIIIQRKSLYEKSYNISVFEKSVERAWDFFCVCSKHKGKAID